MLFENLFEPLSFNNPFGACPTCEGFSRILGIDPDLIIPGKNPGVFEGLSLQPKGETGLVERTVCESRQEIRFPDS